MLDGSGPAELARATVYLQESSQTNLSADISQGIGKKLIRVLKATLPAC